MACLTILTGNDAGAIHPMGEKAVRLGSDPKVEICIEDPGIEPVHCSIERAHGTWGVTAIEGHGVVVDGETVKVAPLEDGSVFELGPVAIRLDNDLHVASLETLTYLMDPILVQPPPMFRSDFEKGPFKKCTRCDRDLTRPNILGHFLVAKVFKRLPTGPEPILEYALCDDCLRTMGEEFSKESWEKVQSFYRDNQAGPRSLSACRHCGSPRATRKEFAIGGLFRGLEESQLVAGTVGLICGACDEKVTENLSKATTDVWGDFLDTHFPGVPADIDAPSAMFI